MASSSKVKGKNKKVPATKERAEFVVNPDEPVHDNWGKLPPYEFQRDRLEFNPYAFGQRTSSDDRFYCKMHEVVYHSVVCKLKNPYVPQFHFDMEMLRKSKPDVMELMDFHGISLLMNCDIPFSPELLREFYATVYFSEEKPRSMIWMSGGIKCEATLAEFGELFGLEEIGRAHV